ncbi:hypothetical protein AAY473_021381 [Plecturocebus cupreus]
MSGLQYCFFKLNITFTMPYPIKLMNKTRLRFPVLPRLVLNSWPQVILLPGPPKVLRRGFSMLVGLVSNSRYQVIHLPWPPKVLGLQIWGFSMLVRLVSNSRPQVIRLPQPPKVLELQALATVPGLLPTSDPVDNQLKARHPLKSNIKQFTTAQSEVY